MKNSKYCHVTACCWDYRHELLGIILLIVATFLTLVTFNSFGIVAMFFVGGLLCCYRHWCCHTHVDHTHCHSVDDELGEGLEVPTKGKHDMHGEKKKQQKK